MTDADKIIIAVVAIEGRIRAAELAGLLGIHKCTAMKRLRRLAGLGIVESDNRKKWQQWMLGRNVGA
jgi:predicted ArsR family transcriptional regulator